jgi:hypothetical protein
MMSSHNDSFVASGSSPTQQSAQVLPDFFIENHGSIFLFHPQNVEAIEWINQHIGSENGFQPYWSTVIIEHRYVADIIAGLRADGFEVQS